MDLLSRKIVGWYLSERMTKELVIQAFHRAIHQRNPQPGLIPHSDQGSQYASNEYQAMLRQYGTSMSRKGNCYDNACAESFHSILKKELIFHETKPLQQGKKRNNGFLNASSVFIMPNEFIRQTGTCRQWSMRRCISEANSSNASLHKSRYKGHLSY